MYTISHNTTSEEELHLKSIDAYSSYKNKFLLLFLCVIVVFIVIIVNGIFPKPIMYLMEQVGLITFTEATNARIHSYTSVGGRGETNTYHDLIGEYRDQKNKKHDLCIQLYIAYHEYLDKEFLENNGNKIPIAYFNFYPDWCYLGITSIGSCYISYSILGILFFYGLILYQRRAKQHLFLKTISEGKLVRPDSFFVYTSKIRYHTFYNYFVIWDTPNGLRRDSKCTISLKEYSFELFFDDEYCALYLKGRTGKRLIVHPKDVEKVIKKFGYKINGFDVEVPKTK